MDEVIVGSSDILLPVPREPLPKSMHINNSSFSSIIYRQTSNIIRTLVGNKIVDHADRRCYNYIFILDLTPGFNGLGKDNCKTRRETFQCSDLVRIIL